MSASEPSPVSEPVPRRASAFRGVYLPQLLMVLAFVVVWELLIRAGIATEFFFGRPTEIVRYLVQNVLSGYLLVHTWVTLYEQLSGFILGTLVGTIIGLALWWSPFLCRVLEPFAVVFNATPKIVMAPILVVWFGIGVLSKVMISVMICGIVAWLTAFEGARTTDSDLIDMVRALGGKRWDAFWRVVVPSSVPWILSAMRINIGLALVGAIAGEFLSSTHGLGYLADRTAKLYEMSHTLAVLFVIAVLAAMQYYLVAHLERYLLRWTEEHELEFLT